MDEADNRENEERERLPPGHVRVYKGAARVATFKGVPSQAIVVCITVIGAVGAQTTPWFYLTIIPVWVILAAITKTDDRAIRQWGLWLRYSVWPMLRYWRSYRLWGAVSFAPRDYRPNRPQARDVVPFVLPPIVFAIVLKMPLIALLAAPAWWLALFIQKRRKA